MTNHPGHRNVRGGFASLYFESGDDPQECRVLGLFFRLGGGRGLGLFPVFPELPDQHKNSHGNATVEDQEGQSHDEPHQQILAAMAQGLQAARKAIPDSLPQRGLLHRGDRKSTRLNSSHP